MLELELYKENILEHYKNPQNKRVIKHARVGRGVNPSCGDVLSVYVLEKGGVVEDMSFEGEGCAISTAAASMLTEHLKGKDMKKLETLSREDIFGMLKVDISPSREKCALLAFRAIKEIV